MPLANCPSQHCKVGLFVFGDPCNIVTASIPFFHHTRSFCSQNSGENEMMPAFLKNYVALHVWDFTISLVLAAEDSVWDSLSNIYDVQTPEDS